MYSRNSSSGAQKSSAIHILPLMSPHGEGADEAGTGSSMATGLPREVIRNRLPALVCLNSRAKLVLAAKAPTRVSSAFSKLVAFIQPV